MRFFLSIIVSSFFLSSAVLASPSDKRGQAKVTLDVSGTTADELLREVAGYVSLKGAEVRVDSERAALRGLRADGVSLNVLLRDGRADVQCAAVLKQDSKLLPTSQKHRLTGWRTKKQVQVAAETLRACTKSLASAVKRAAADLS